jgi:hypothetical protein
MYSRTFTLPKAQRLFQTSERDCSVPVFAALADVSEDEVCQDLPNVRLGEVSVEKWEAWLKTKGFDARRREGCSSDELPCAHLVALYDPRDERDFHWIYRDSDGDVHDPSPTFSAMPANDPRMRDLSCYHTKVLTISVSRLQGENRDSEPFPVHPSEYLEGAAATNNQDLKRYDKLLQDESVFRREQ